MSGISLSAHDKQSHTTMDSSLPFQRPKIRLRSSSATLPRSPVPSSPLVGPQEPRKKHRHHHSVHTHHHVPHVSRRHAKESQQNSGDKTGVYWDPSRPPSRVDQSGSSPVNRSRRVSPAGRAGRGRDVSATIKSEDIAKERHRERVRDKELRESLQALSDQSMKTTRQLDDVYYSILEKLSVLQSTISNLQDLSSMTKTLHSAFQSETGTFEADMREQIEAFGGFDNPKQRIGDFETRVKISKAKADELSARLESARARVLALETEEKEYQDMVSRRFRMVWVILGSIGAFIIAIYTLQALKQPSSQIGLRSNLSKSQTIPGRMASVVEEMPETFSSAAKEISRAVFDAHASMSATQNSSAIPTSSSRPRLKEDDQRLHVFDEL